jgi:NAD(P)-dependent dehydrogenase (short-subunit alcohol dehydrogenase family)
MAEVGQVYGLVNNAGIGEARPAVRETPEQFRQVIDVNLNRVSWPSSGHGADTSGCALVTS